jgi:hypothetical protein
MEVAPLREIIPSSALKAKVYTCNIPGLLLLEGTSFIIQQMENNGYLAYGVRDDDCPDGIRTELTDVEKAMAIDKYHLSIYASDDSSIGEKETESETAPEPMINASSIRLGTSLRQGTVPRPGFVSRPIPSLPE